MPTNEELLCLHVRELPAARSEHKIRCETFPREELSALHENRSLHRNRSRLLFTMAQGSSATVDTCEWDAIGWRSSESKNVILSGLRTGALPLGENEASAEEAWEHCCHLPALQGEGAQLEQFKKRLASRRQQIGGRIERAALDGAAAAHDRMKHPRPARNQRGKPSFHLPPAEKLLCQGIKNNRRAGLLPSQLQSTRGECKVIKPQKFEELAHQAARRAKFRRSIAAHGHEQRAAA